MMNENVNENDVDITRKEDHNQQWECEEKVRESMLADFNEYIVSTYGGNKASQYMEFLKWRSHLINLAVNSMSIDTIAAQSEYSECDGILHFTDHSVRDNTKLCHQYDRYNRSIRSVLNSATILEQLIDNLDIIGDTIKQARIDEMEFKNEWEKETVL